jgi:predicted alpha-1,2-mannosidase
MIIKNIFILALLCSAVLYSQNKQERLTEFVNPFIGTSNGGNTFPGAVVPWGLVSVSPHNAPGAPSGYIHGGKYFYGLGHAHLSGTGCADLGSVILTAAKKEISTDAEKYKTTYANEQALPGFYKVDLNELKLTVEAAATERCGFTKFVSAENGEINILIDAGRSLALVGGGKVVFKSGNRVEGYNISGGFCGEENRQTVYFSAEVSEEAIERNLFAGDQKINSDSTEVKDFPIVCGMKFKMEKGKTIFVKIGISYVSIQNARMNLEKEIPGWNFELVKSKAEKLWEENLSRIIVEGGSRNDKIKFYTAIYHSLIHPNIINDVNGEFPLMGRTGIGKYADRNRYSVFSLWDTYRTLHPLLTLVYPERQSEIIKTMIDMFAESGYLPKWELAGNETYMMVGDAASIVIASSYVKGINDFDASTAFDAMLKPATIKNGEDAPPIRAGYHYQLKHGYIPFDQDMTKAWWVWGTVSTSLEYCLSDFAISQMAKKLGKPEKQKEFYNRSLFYKNSFDAETKFMRPRLANCNWLTPFDSLATEGSGDWSGSGGPGYVEGNAWNYTWFVPHDVPGLINLFGGEKQFAEKLKQSFENKQFTINNEPDIAYPYLFTYIKGEEKLTAKLVKEIVEKDFGVDENGLPGNDDCGAISSWFIFSALGFYPACPASESYRLGVPLFDKATIHLNGKYFAREDFVIKKQNENRKILLNGKRINDYRIENAEIIKGGELIFGE